MSSSFARASAVLSSIVFLMYKKLEVKYKQPSLKIESTLNKWAHFTNYIKFIVS